MNHLRTDFANGSTTSSQQSLLFVDSRGEAKINSGSGSSSTGGYKNHKKGKERPVCSHCGVVRHTMDKCYKIHGYPPGYKPKSRNAQVNQVLGTDLGPDSSAQSQAHFGSQPQFPYFQFGNRSQGPM